MKSKDKIIASAIATAITMAASAVYAQEAAVPGSPASSAPTAPAGAPVTDTEKCFGVAKAGMNDCASAGHSCAGSAATDKQSDAFIFMPKGLCDKIAGGSLTAPSGGASGSSPAAAPDAAKSTS